MDFDFEWKEEYSTGIDEIDVQHRNMLSMIKRIYDIGQNIIDKEFVGQLLDELEKNLQNHFTCEEELMKEHGYPKLEEQKHQHRLIRETLHQLMKEVRSDRFRLLQLAFHLGRWFVDHDNRFDKEFGRFVARDRNTS